MHKKLFIKFIYSYLLAFSFLLSSQCIAADLNDVVNSPLEADISIVKLNKVGDMGSNLSSAITSDSLSETALINLDSIENESTASAKPAGNITSVKESPVILPVAKNPYSQLISLAFSGKGENGVRNYADAAEQFCRDARDHNDANAEFALGWMYENGKGVVKDKNISVIFFSMAAKQNHKSARESLIASTGNPNIATLPKCMSQPPVGSVLATSHSNSTSSQLESAPFYTKGPIYKLVSKIAPRFNIDTDLAMAFIAVESGFNPNATSNRNAQGLMQLIPETAVRFKVKNAYDPEQNIKGGLAYLQWLLTYFEGDVELVAAAYNSGENTVDKFKGVPPYPETRKYVKKIASLYKKSYHPFREDLGISKKSTINKVSG